MYNLENIKLILANANNSILHKVVNKDMLDMEKIIVSHSIVYVKSGRVIINTYDYKQYTVTDGEMLFIPRDSYLISDYITNEKEMEVYLFFFDYKITSEFLQNISISDKETKKRLLKIDVTKNILNYINALESVNYTNPTNTHLLKTKLFELLHLVCESHEDFANILATQESDKTDIQEYMLQHYDKNLSLKDWATLSGCSLSTFNRRFKKEYDISPKKWMIEQNMKLANSALKNGATVSACASEFGYSNSSNFIKAFKEIYKITPKQYALT
jgi:AraC-like DNA-binding protein